MQPTVVVGAEMVGLAMARALRRLLPDLPVLVPETEERPAAHQTGHDFEVIHSGVHCTPGSFQARIAVNGAGMLKASAATVYVTNRGSVDRELCAT